MYDLPPLPDGVRTLTNVELARLRTKFPKVPSSPDQCPTCRGRGSFRWYAYAMRSGQALFEPGAEREIVEFKCNCVDQWLAHLFLLNANIGDSYQRLSWHDVAAEPGAVAKVQAYLATAEPFVQAGIGLILYGTKGAGKTLLATLVLKALMAAGHDGYFTTFSEMIDTYTGGWYDAEEKAWFHKRIKNAGVLVLDDLGREYQGRQQTDLPRSSFDEVFRHRTAAATPTIITTNFDMTKVHNTYGEHVMSLLQERSSTYQFTGEDFRKGPNRDRLLDEIEQGLTRPVVLG